MQFYLKHFFFVYVNRNIFQNTAAKNHINVANAQNNSITKLIYVDIFACTLARNLISVRHAVRVLFVKTIWLNMWIRTDAIANLVAPLQLQLLL